ncbi:MAG: glycosyltransferase family 4 protein [Lautropia sp.]
MFKTLSDDASERSEPTATRGLPEREPRRGRMVVMIELRPAFDGFAGIPQETRLLFRGLCLSPKLKVEGLLQAARRTLSRGTTFEQAGKPSRPLTEDRRINRYSRVVISMLGRPQLSRVGRAADVVQGRLKPLSLMAATMLGFGRVPLTAFRSTYFEDFVWRAFFAKTLAADDFSLVARTDMRVSSVSWHAMHDAGIGLQKLTGRALYPRLDTRGIDVFIAQTPYPGRVDPATKLVVRYHDAIPVFMPHTISDRSAHQAEHFNALRNCVRSGAWFACVSESTRKDLLRLFPEAEPRARVVHNMVSHHYFPEPNGPERIPEIIRSRINEGNARIKLRPRFESIDAEQGFYRACLQGRTPRYLLIVSTLEPRKNHARLLAAWEAIRSEVDPELKLVVVGSLGWSADEIAAAMRPWIDRGELFALHAVPAPDLRVLYRHALATVCPSLGEGFDYSGVEAMRCGGVVVASDIAVHREIYDDAAEYFDPYSTASLSRCLARVLYESGSDTLRETLRARGAEVAQRYLPERILPRWDALLQEVRGEQPRPAGVATAAPALQIQRD